MTVVYVFKSTQADSRPWRVLGMCQSVSSLGAGLTLTEWDINALCGGQKQISDSETKMCPGLIGVTLTLQ